jgi:flagellar basal-body rod protein FlgC
MGFLSSIDISGSALSAQRLKMDVISNNIANINTTQTSTGGPYRRRVCTLSEMEGSSFSSVFNEEVGAGVEVSSITEDPSPFKLEYDPTNPLANAAGYVEYPNVDTVTELTDMMSVTRAYEASVTALDATKGMAVKALEIGK